VLVSVAIVALKSRMLVPVLLPLMIFACRGNSA
jgi:hypothetical protein